MFSSNSFLVRLLTTLAVLVSTEAFFLKWGSENSQSTMPKTWVQPVSYNPYRPNYVYSPYTEQRKIYQPMMHEPAISAAAAHQQMQTYPISVPAGSKLSPISLQHVQLVPCMCPVAPEEVDKLQESLGPGPYIAQSNYINQQSSQEQQQASGKQ